MVRLAGAVAGGVGIRVGVLGDEATRNPISEVVYIPLRLIYIISLIRT